MDIIGPSLRIRVVGTLNAIISLIKVSVEAESSDTVLQQLLVFKNIFSCTFTYLIQRVFFQTLASSS